MKKLPAVERVRISLKEGLTVLDLKSNNTVTLAQLRQIIKDNGFVSADILVVAKGTPSSDRRTFSVADTDEQLTLDGPPRKEGDQWKLRVPAPEKS